MWLIQKVLCRFGRHRRSRYHAKADDDRGWRSECVGCHVRMRWISASNRWVAIGDPRASRGKKR